MDWGFDLRRRAVGYQQRCAHRLGSMMAALVVGYRNIVGLRNQPMILLVTLRVILRACCAARNLAMGIRN